MKLDAGTVTGSFVFGLLGIMFIFFSLIMRISSKNQKRRCTLRVNGTVVQVIVENSSTDEGFRHYPVYEYTVDGVVYRKRSKFSKKVPDCKTGDMVYILCDPKEPEYYYIEGHSDNRFFGLYLAIGIILLIVSVLTAIPLFL